jgi:flavorubredoxin
VKRARVDDPSDRHQERATDGATMTANPPQTMMPSSLSFPPVCPTKLVPPTKIAEDTWVIHQVQGALGQPLDIYLNSMVILGSEPVIVDTGTPANRAQWLEDVFSIVEPKDVRWIFLSHDDVDHTGNLDEALSACPNATVVCNWAMVERHTNCFEFPLHRCRWVMDGESFDVGDRTLFAIRPPVFDSPTTRGLYDPKTQVYWAVDTFATPLPDASMGIADLDQDFWEFGLMLFALGAVSPWITMTDPVKYNRHVDRTQDLDIVTIAACHSPVIEGPYIEKAFDRIRQLATLDLPELPGQSILDQIVAATSQAPA